MKRFILVFAFLWTASGSGQGVPQSEIDALIQFYNSTNGPNWKSRTFWFSNHPVGHWYGVDTSIINGVEHITRISLPNNNLTGTVSIANLPMLEELALDNNYISALTISGSNGLKTLFIGHNPVTSFDMSTLPTSLEKLRVVNIDNMNLTTLNIGHLTNLKELWVGFNQLSNFDFTTLPSSLEVLDAEENLLTSINLSHMTNLKVLNLNDNLLSNFDFSTLPQTIQDLKIEGNGLTTLDLVGFPNLRALYIGNNQLSNFNFNALPQTMEELSVGRNHFTSIDVGHLINLKKLDIWDNPINTPLDLNNHHQLSILGAGNTQIPVFRLKSQMNYSNSTVYMGDAVKCVEVHNPAVVGTYWSIIWLTGYYKNFRTNCSQYMATAEENSTKTNRLSVVSPMDNTLILKGNARVQKVEIYNTAGQLAKVLLGNDRDVSNLSKGVYYLKITTDKGIETIKVIK